MCKKTQSERFREAARKAEADTSDDALDRVFGKLDLKRKPEAAEDAEDEEARPSGGQGKTR